MTMANLTAATAALQAVEAAYTGKMAEIDAAIATATQAVGNTARTFYLDAVAGDDGNDGSQAAPLKTIDQAILRHVIGGQTTIRLLSDLTITGRVSMPYGSVRVVGTGAETVTFGSGAPYVDANGLTFSPHLYLSAMGGNFRFDKLKIALASGGAGYDYNHAIHPFAPSAFWFSLCEFVNIGASDQSLFLNAAGLDFTLTQMTYDQSAAGRFVSGVTAGTDPNTLSTIKYTNLASL